MFQHTDTRLMLTMVGVGTSPINLTIGLFMGTPKIHIQHEPKLKLSLIFYVVDFFFRSLH